MSGRDLAKGVMCLGEVIEYAIKEVLSSLLSFSEILAVSYQR